MTTSIFRPGVGAAVAVALAAAQPVQAEHAATDPPGYVVYADVVQVSPRYGWRTITEPERQCVDVAGRSYDRYGHRYAHRYRDWPDRGDRWRRRHDGGEVAAGLVGGLIGGLIGHQFGGGNGKTAFTLAGAALGASMAGDHVRRSRVYDDHPAHTASTVRRCTETRQTRQVRGVDGYDVTYRYQGRTFHKWMDEHPGDTVRVHVSVEPADDLARR